MRQRLPFLRSVIWFHQYPIERINNFLGRCRSVYPAGRALHRRLQGNYGPGEIPANFSPGAPASSGFLFKKSDFRLTYSPGLRSRSFSTRRAATSSWISTNGKRIRTFDQIDPLYFPLSLLKETKKEGISKRRGDTLEFCSRCSCANCRNELAWRIRCGGSLARVIFYIFRAIAASFPPGRKNFDPAREIYLSAGNYTRNIVAPGGSPARRRGIIRRRMFARN